jgi:hypothetical protein
MASNEQSKSDVVLDHIVYTYYIYFSFLSTNKPVSFLSKKKQHLFCLAQLMPREDSADIHGIKIFPYPAVP